MKSKIIWRVIDNLANKSISRADMRFSEICYVRANEFEKPWTLYFAMDEMPEESLKNQKATKKDFWKCINLSVSRSIYINYPFVFNDKNYVMFAFTISYYQHLMIKYCTNIHTVQINILQHFPNSWLEMRASACR